MDKTHFDVIICGGGLAGLTAALQMKQIRPQTSVCVVEKNSFPLPEAAHKVGESSVEIGAHYFAEMLHQRDHIDQHQLPKLGLRYFFGASKEDLSRLDKRCEMGGNRFLPSKSYQIDRGRFENHLAAEVQQAGVVLLTEHRIKEVEVETADIPHRLVVEDGNATTKALTAQWLFDGSGRAGLLKRKLGLAKESPHKAHAVWFRINASLRIDGVCDDDAWHERHHHADRRWLSTVHLMGEGYWVWFIPLALGATSVEIVADAQLHPYERMKTFDVACEWLNEFEPLAAQMVSAEQDKLLDFAGYRNYSYDCKQIFSDRWALLGEAGFFLDPFYSPGSDFIAMGNTMATDLAARSLDGQPTTVQRAAILDGVLRSLFSNHLNVYHQQYPLFANAKVMAAKVVWDFAYYWAVPAHLFFHDQLTNTTMFARNRSVFDEVAILGREVQEVFRRWHAIDDDPYAGRYVDVPDMPLMEQLNSALMANLTTAESIQKLRDNLMLLKEVAAELRDWLVRNYTTISFDNLAVIQTLDFAESRFLEPLWAGLDLGVVS